MNDYNGNALMGMAIPQIDFWYQYNFTVEQACAYFQIGENKMRSIIANNPNADFVLHIGTRTLIKKPSFERFIDRVNVI